MISVLLFTVIQAGLSALGSVMFGGVLAYAFVRMRGEALAKLSMLPFFLPPLVVVLGVLNVFGREAFGLAGILLCHMVLNIPLATKMFYDGYKDMPRAQVRLAVQFGRVFQLLDCEVFRARLRRVFAIIFLYCLLSFTIVLTLGGGLKNTTLEVAIYQAIYYEFNFSRAFFLALLQAVIGLIVYLIANSGRVERLSSAHQREPLPWGRARMAIGGLAIVVFTFTFLPVVILLIKAVAGLTGFLDRETVALIVMACLNSFKLAFATVLLVHGLSWLLVRHGQETLAWIIGALSPLCIATALIFAVRPFANPFDHGVFFVALLQALAYLPFVVNFWQMRLAEIPREEMRLVTLHFPKFWGRARNFWIPVLRNRFAEITAMVFALSIGDLGLLPLFSPKDFSTLPQMVWKLIGSYQIPAANGVSFIMLAIIGFILVMPRFLERKDA